MQFDRSAYLEANPTRRSYEIGGITWVVSHDAAFDMLAVFKSHGLKTLSEQAVNELILSNGKSVFQQVAKAIILEPPICGTAAEAEETGGLTVEELNPQHVNQLIGKLMAAWEVDGQAEAATFPDGGS